MKRPSAVCELENADRPLWGRDADRPLAHRHGPAFTLELLQECDARGAERIGEQDATADG